MHNKAKIALNTSKNSLCRETGHDFQGTTSNVYRVCSRSHCGAAQRLANGQWIDVQPVQRRKEEKQPQAVPVMSVLDACDHIGVQCLGDTLPRTNLHDYWTQGMKASTCTCGKPWQGTYCRSCGSKEQPKEVQA